MCIGRETGPSRAGKGSQVCQTRDIEVELMALEVIFEANLTGQKPDQAGTMAHIVRRAREEIVRLRTEAAVAEDREINRNAKRQIDRNGS